MWIYSIALLNVRGIRSSCLSGLTWAAEAWPAVFRNGHPGAAMKLPLSLPRSGKGTNTHLTTQKNRYLWCTPSPENWGLTQTITSIREILWGVIQNKRCYLWSPRTARAPKYLFNSVSGFRFLTSKSREDSWVNSVKSISNISCINEKQLQFLPKVHNSRNRRG